ncbi:hypothetical protein SUGI_0197230 [Cryptomeria japonica]|uniref:transcription factor MYB82 n=1 Tax=Cryptomeria japonica TaxID=3369 RepID=UPI002408C17D|nr:transcription factor MYB82 [Cryptomeria japonica]GLJ12759.1 hypothetical protein SUGI_0197230 [Cryptomeria japonica]
MGRKRCCSHLGLNNGPWTPHEDLLLKKFVQTHGEGHWSILPLKAGLGRCGRSCRLRWMNYVRPGIKHGVFSAAEEELIIKLHDLLGNRWSMIAARVPGRTDNQIKNAWYSRLSKKHVRTNMTERKILEYESSSNEIILSQDRYGEKIGAQNWNDDANHLANHSELHQQEENKEPYFEWQSPQQHNMAKDVPTMKNFSPTVKNVNDEGFYSQPSSLISAVETLNAISMSPTNFDGVGMPTCKMGLNLHHKFPT